MRLDRRLVSGGEFSSRTAAQAAIRERLILVNGAVADKPAAMVADNDIVSVIRRSHPYVSRGGVKLAAALSHFDLEVKDKVCLDLGASTGGFTEVLLERGAAKVFSVDVGRNQLHARISGDRRVISLEKTHAKNLTRSLVPDAIEIIVCDVSFISIRKALPPALKLAGDSARLVALIKPQFELGPEWIGKGGSVRAGDEELKALIDEIGNWLDSKGWRGLGAIESPIRGGGGAREFLIAATR